MRPIPRNYLIHKVKVLSEIIRDTWGNEIPGTETVISFVRVEPKTKLVIDKQNRQVKLSALVFYDMVNSTPAHEFSVSDRIIFKGRTYNIAVIDELYDASKLHHLEIGLTL
jgi:hypothetical protein